MKKMILSAVMLVFAASGRAQEAGAASPTEHNEWLTTFEAVAVDADLDIKFVKVPDTEAPKIVYDTKGSYTSKFRAEVKDKTLRISERPDSRRPDRTEVTVYYNTLQSVSLSGAAAVVTAGNIRSVTSITVMWSADKRTPVRCAKKRTSIRPASAIRSWCATCPTTPACTGS